MTRALRALGGTGDPHVQVGRIPVQMITGSGDGTPITGRLPITIPPHAPLGAGVRREARSVAR